MGFQADPDGMLSLDIGEVAEPLTGDSMAQPATWKDGTSVSPSLPGRVKAHIHMDCATLYAYEVRPKS